MNRSVSSSRRILRNVFVIVGISVALFTSTIASADPSQKKIADPSKDDRLRQSLFIGGSSAFVLGYGYAAGMGGLVYRTADGRAPSDMFVPVAGPYMALAQKQLSLEFLVSGRLLDSYFRNQTGAVTVGDVAVFEGGAMLFGFEYLILLADPIVQGFGLAATGAAAVVPGDTSGSLPSSPSNPRWSVGPAWNAGPGVSLSVTSW